MHHDPELHASRCMRRAQLTERGSHPRGRVSVPEPVGHKAVTEILVDRPAGLSIASLHVRSQRPTPSASSSDEICCDSAVKFSRSARSNQHGSLRMSTIVASHCESGSPVGAAVAA